VLGVAHGYARHVKTLFLPLLQITN
jgi:hypothetical protein